MKALQSGIVPFYENGLDEVIRRNSEESRISFTTEYSEAAKGQDFIFIAVNTPPTRGGRPTLNQITSVARSLAPHIDPGTIVVNKSTGPVGMASLIHWILSEHSREGNVHVVSNPEFIREGYGVYDFMHPFHIVVGSWDVQAGLAVGRLFESLDTQITYCDPGTAEMTKLVSNAFRAVKISFINEIAAICDSLHIDVEQISQIVGKDKSIGPAFLKAGVGWGGNCLPKDVITLQHVAKTSGVQARVIGSALAVNQDQPAMVVDKLKSMLGDLEGKTIGVLGLAFKGGTDDVRRSPAIEVVLQLRKEGCDIKAYDPMAMKVAEPTFSDVDFCGDAYEVAARSDAVVLLTDWPEFRDPDLNKLRDLMNEPYFVDGRNVFDPEVMTAANFVYAGIGHGYPNEVGGNGVASKAQAGGRSDELRADCTAFRCGRGAIQSPRGED